MFGPQPTAIAKQVIDLFFEAKMFFFMKCKDGWHTSAKVSTFGEILLAVAPGFPFRGCIGSKKRPPVRVNERPL